MRMASSSGGDSAALHVGLSLLQAVQFELGHQGACRDAHKLASLRQVEQAALPHAVRLCCDILQGHSADVEVGTLALDVLRSWLADPGDEGDTLGRLSPGDAVDVCPSLLPILLDHAMKDEGGISAAATDALVSCRLPACLSTEGRRRG